MKTVRLIMTGFFVAFAITVAQGASTRVLTRISNETGVPLGTLQAERATTGLGYGDLENANLLANASGQSFDTIVGKFHAGEGWGKIAHDYGLNLGKLVSGAHRSDRAALHAQNGVHGKSATHVRSNHVRSGKGVGHGQGGGKGQGSVHKSNHGHD